jgi:hypothetical protein
MRGDTYNCKCNGMRDHTDILEVWSTLLGMISKESVFVGWLMRWERGSEKGRDFLIVIL